MKLLTVGLRGPSGYLRADSQPLPDDDADEQFALVTASLADQDVVSLPWLAVRTADVLLVRLTSVGP
jgi:hypothetical protein